MGLFSRRRRRPEKHFRRTQSGFAVVNPDISYDHAAGVDVRDAAQQANLNSGLRQVEADGALGELEQVVLARQAEREQLEQREAEKRRRRDEGRLNHLNIAAERLSGAAGEDAATRFGGIPAEATFDIDTFASELHSTEQSYVNYTQMSGQVLLGSGDDRIQLDVKAHAWQNEAGTSEKPEFTYSYRGETVYSPEGLYKTVKRHRDAS